MLPTRIENVKTRNYVVRRLRTDTPAARFLKAWLQMPNRRYIVRVIAAGWPGNLRIARNRRSGTRTRFFRISCMI
jgi:hypothetical protein